MSSEIKKDDGQEYTKLSKYYLALFYAALGVYAIGHMVGWLGNLTTAEVSIKTLAAFMLLSIIARLAIQALQVVELKEEEKQHQDQG